jgi:para-aminobenzoate synthetase component I
MASPPILRFPLPATLTPRRALAALRGLPGRVLLETARGSRGRSLLSAAPPLTVTWTAGGLQVEAVGRDPWAGRFRGTGEGGGLRDPFAFLDWFPARNGPGGWMGYVAYEMADHLERLPPAPMGGPGLPPLRFGAHDWWVTWEGRGQPPVLEGAALPSHAGGEAEAGKELAGRLEEVRGKLLEGLGKPQSDHGLGVQWQPVGTPVPEDRLPPSVTSSLPREAFQGAVERIRRHIRQGDLFQANLTQLLCAPLPGATGEDLYLRLVEESAAPFAAYLETPAGEIASISPESFLSVRGDRVTTHPIKGTAPRDADPVRDRALAEALVGSAKDRAENVMIVDLLRNDLSRVSLPGSVRVPRLAEWEPHPTVHHLVSTVTATLRPGVGPGELLRATFPGGSITGAPKVRAMELLRGLEPVPRGVYTGALGLVNFRREVELSIAIRTAVVANGLAWYGTGGGITLASDPEEEWRETLAKARAFLQAMGLFLERETKA